MIAITPRGFKDVLPEEARIREKLTRSVQDVLELWGYAPIETPTLEVLSVLETASQVDAGAFRLFDADNKLLVLRPDVTLPVARIVASRLGTADAPYRFRYVLPIFREQESLRGQAREFTQIGIEQIGQEGPLSDAEVITILVESLRACGLRDFRVAICSVAVLRALVEASSQAPAWGAAVLDAFHTSDIVALDELVAAPELDPRYGAALSALIRINGGKEAFADVRNMVADLGLSAALEDMERTWELLEVAGVSEDVVVDFSIASELDYYTGLVMEAYAPGYGKPLGGGGRYDNLLASFGASAPAAGFAFSLERVMAALAEQNRLVSEQVGIQQVKGIDDADTVRQVIELHRAGKSALIAARKGAAVLPGEAQQEDAAILTSDAQREGAVILPDDAQREGGRS